MASKAPLETANVYHQLPVALPDDFLRTEPPTDAKPMTMKRITWSDTSIPEFRNGYACLLDNVLSPSECATLIHLAESSVAPASRGADGGSWTPARVNIGHGLEVLQTSYRNSDRIIWDRQQVMDRLWDRLVAGAPQLEKDLAEVKLEGPAARGGETVWRFSHLNERMRFLRYGPGQFFRAHCDGAYGETKDGRELLTFYTMHLYLNDCVAEADPENREGTELVGGATSFMSFDEKRKVDVDCKAGRVLVFRHKGLYHCGADVVRGTKYTMRTDIVYEKVKGKGGR